MFDKTTGTNPSGQDVTGFSRPDLSTEEQTGHVAGIVARILEATRLVEVVESSANLVNQVHLLCRVKAENEKKLVNTVVSALLTQEARTEDLDCHVGKQFLLRNGNVKYGWVFSFGAPDLNTITDSIAEALDQFIPKQEVLETPLLGHGTQPSSGPGARGAKPVGSA